MRRLLWVGVGAVGAVVALRRLEQTARRYTPAGVADQVEAVGRRTGETARGLLDTFSTSRETRERELVASLLVTPEGGDARAAMGRRSSADDAPRHRSAPSGRVDDDEPLYDF